MTHTTPARKQGRAFTLVELLVTIAIMAGLIAILTPMVFKARKTAVRTRMASDLQAIATALEAYKADFGDYPRVAYDPNPALTSGPTVYDVDRPNAPSGAEILCRALVSPSPAVETPTPAAGMIPIQDGNDGPGFRLRAQGKVYPPYLAADKFKMGPMTGTANAATNSLRWVLQDSDGNPILYFPRRNPAPAATQYLFPMTGGSVAFPTSYPPAATVLTGANAPAEQFAYDVFDNVLYFLRAGETAGDITNASKRIHILLHDYNPAKPMDTTTNFNGLIDTDQNEGPAVSDHYLLWAAGPDGKFGTDSVTPSAKDIAACDDVTNFNQ